MTFHETILKKLLEYRESHPYFNFIARQRGGKGDRFNTGHWFQGTDEYAFVGIVNANGGSNRTKSIGVSISPTTKGFSCYLEIAFNEEKDSDLIEIYESLANKIVGLKSVASTRYTKRIGDLTEEDFTPLFEFLDSYYFVIIEEFKKNDKESVLISDQKFNKILEKINSYRLTVKIPHTSDKSRINLNTILYGPPGTGKTYETKELAIQIANPDFKNNNGLLEGDKRKKIIEEYARLQSVGQIDFITFHQSFSYEDFVEGIKPKTTNDKKIFYSVKPGVFKNICSKAEDNYLDAIKGVSGELSFADAFEKLQEEWEENTDMKFSMKREGYDFTITGFTDRSIQFRKSSGGTGHTLSIATLRDGYYGTKVIRSTGVGIYYPGILEKLKSYQSQNTYVNKSLKKFVLIIDEINRGNISAIFGELITLLEPDKRLGEAEEIILKLPYSSGENFGVPPNLYIIGTMNTADRSVEALDTALRRRFVFKEVMPKPSLLSGITFNGFNLESVLTAINDRVKVLLDRDHTIGHSYFIKLTSGDTDGLSDVFKNNVIPLLQEYFYNDYEKIALVLGPGFVKEKENKQNIFLTSNNIDEPAMEKEYELIPKIGDIEKAVGQLLGLSNEEEQ